MMKKVWLILLAVVLVFGLVFVGCGGGGSKEEEGGEEEGGDEEEVLVEKTLFDLETDEGIQALALGSITITDANEIKPLVQAGGSSDISFEIVDNGGKNAIKYTVGGSTNWGAGIDLRYAAFGFIAGDKLSIKGNVLAMGAGAAPGSGQRRFDLNRKVGSEYATIGGVETTKLTTGAFDFDITLADADIPDIKGGNPAGIRFEGRSGGMVVQINTIKITGMRAVTIKPLPAPVLVAGVENVATWTAVEGASGYKVYVAATGGAFELKATLGPSATSYSLLDISVPDGAYQIKIIALGVDGASKDSAESNVVTVTRVTPAQLVLFDADNGGWQTGYNATVGTEGGNTAVNFDNPINTTGKTRVYIKLNNADHDYFGGSVEGNANADGTGGWANNQLWSGFGKVSPSDSGKTDTFYGGFAYTATEGEGEDAVEVDKFVGGFKKLMIQTAVSFDEVIKIWIE